MPDYRRAFVPGGCWFFTVAVLDRRSVLLVEKIDCCGQRRLGRGCTIPSASMYSSSFPDHLHAVLTLPPGDADFSVRSRMIKTRFAWSLAPTEPRSRVRVARGERGIWQRRFWEHLIRDERDYARDVEYCYIKPVKHGLVRRVADWPSSSFHRDVRAGLFPEDWAGEADAAVEFGERQP